MKSRRERLGEYMCLGETDVIYVLLADSLKE